MRTRQELAAEWQKIFGFKPQPLMSVEFMAGNLAYRQQIKDSGLNYAKLHKRLLALANDLQGKPNLRHITIKAGTKVIRMWQGEPHEVTILSTSEFHYKGQAFSSLSALANHITGTKWNGQVFFGLRKQQADAR